MLKDGNVLLDLSNLEQYSLYDEDFSKLKALSLSGTQNSEILNGMLRNKNFQMNIVILNLSGTEGLH